MPVKAAAAVLRVQLPIYFPSPSESPGTARSILSLSRCHESCVANFARSQLSREVPFA